MPIGERGARLAESLAVLRKLWSGERRHARRPLLQVRGGGDAAAAAPGRRAADLVRRPVGRGACGAIARLTDGWMSYVVTPRHVPPGARQDRRGGERGGPRLRPRLRHGPPPVHRVDDTYEKALDAATLSLSKRYAMDFRKAAQRYCALGPPHEVVETIRRFHEAGVRHVILDFVGPYEERDTADRTLRARGAAIAGGPARAYWHSLKDTTMRLGMLLNYSGQARRPQR